MLESEIITAYDMLDMRLQRKGEADKALVTATDVLEAVRIVKTANGEIVGKNEDERKAAARAALAEQNGQVTAAKMGVADASLLLQIAENRVDCLKLQMRLMEFNKKTV